MKPYCHFYVNEKTCPFDKSCIFCMRMQSFAYMTGCVCASYVCLNTQRSRWNWAWWIWHYNGCSWDHQCMMMMKWIKLIWVKQVSFIHHKQLTKSVNKHLNVISVILKQKERVTEITTKKKIITGIAFVFQATKVRKY